MSVEERFYSEVIASAEDALPAVIPDCESEVAEKMFDAVVAPFFIGIEDRLGVTIDAGVSKDFHGLGTDQETLIDQFLHQFAQIVAQCVWVDIVFVA